MNTIDWNHSLQKQNSYIALTNFRNLVKHILQNRPDDPEEKLELIREHLDELNDLLNKWGIDFERNPAECL